MKKLIFTLTILLMIGSMLAITFDYNGGLRTRASMSNDPWDADGGQIDSRLRLKIESEFHPQLILAAKFEIGNIAWGNGTGAIGTGCNGFNIETSELYFDYLMETYGAKLRVGQQYWADHRSLILDNYFSGVMLSFDDCMGLKTELAWIKVKEKNRFVKDDYDVFFVNVVAESPMPMGVLALFGNDADTETQNLTMMPFITLQAGVAKLDLTAYLDHDFDENMAFGASVKADVKVNELQIGADLLYMSEDQLTQLSHYYMNGLYIFGIGSLNDSTDLYFGGNYGGNGFISAVGNARMPINNDLCAFGAAGYLMNKDNAIGAEVNLGLEYQAIPEFLKFCGFAALGFPDKNALSSLVTAEMNYLFGLTALVKF